MASAENPADGGPAEASVPGKAQDARARPAGVRARRQHGRTPGLRPARPGRGKGAPSPPGGAPPADPRSCTADATPACPAKPAQPSWQQPLHPPSRDPTAVPAAGSRARTRTRGAPGTPGSGRRFRSRARLRRGRGGRGPGGSTGRAPAQRSPWAGLRRLAPPRACALRAVGGASRAFRPRACAVPGRGRFFFPPSPASFFESAAGRCGCKMASRGVRGAEGAAVSG